MAFTASIHDFYIYSSIWTSRPSTRVLFCSTFGHFHRLSLYSAGFSNLTSYMNLSSYCVSYFTNGITTQRSCVSVIWEPCLDPPFPSAAHVTTMAPPIYLQICPVCSNLAATAHFVSCLYCCRNFPLPPSRSPHCIRMRNSQTQAQRKHMIHSFSYNSREQPL